MFASEIFGKEKKKSAEGEDQLYDLLGCHPQSSTEQIQAEYRTRVRRLHPDKCCDVGADTLAAREAEFCRLQRAKDILTDPVQRADYDKWRNSGLTLSYRRWREIGADKLHSSMHWISTSGPKCPRLEGQSPETPVLATNNNRLNVQSVSPVQFRRHSETNTNQALLEQFRNYRI